MAARFCERVAGSWGAERPLGGAGGALDAAGRERIMMRPGQVVVSASSPSSDKMWQACRMILRGLGDGGALAVSPVLHLRVIGVIGGAGPGVCLAGLIGEPAEHFGALPGQVPG